MGGTAHSYSRGEERGARGRQLGEVALDVPEVLASTASSDRGAHDRRDVEVHLGHPRGQHVGAVRGGCGIVVTVDEDPWCTVRGDDGHPVSRGYTCTKGRGLAGWHHGPTRLDRPRRAATETGWSVVLDDLAARSANVIGTSRTRRRRPLPRHRHRVRRRRAGRGELWLPSIGSRSFLTAATVDNAPVLVAAELVTGNAMLNPVWDPTAGVTVFVGHQSGRVARVRHHPPRPGRGICARPRRGAAPVGARPAPQRDRRASPMRTSRPRPERRRGARPRRDGLLPWGPTRGELRATAPRGTWQALRGALAAFTIERAAARAESSPEARAPRSPTYGRDPARPAVQCGTGTTMASDGVLVEWLRWVLLIAHRLARPPGRHGVQTAR